MRRLEGERMTNKGGRPPLFRSADELEQHFFDYIDYCDRNKLMPNISGFCVFMKREKGIQIHRDTYYAYAKRDGFADTIKSIDEAIEDAVLNNKTQKDLLKIAYLNNKCGYKQEQRIEHAGDIMLTAKQDWQSRVAALDEDKRERLLYHMREIKGLLSE